MKRVKLRVVPLSLSPSCVTRKKTSRKKWPREFKRSESADKHVCRHLWKARTLLESQRFEMRAIIKAEEINNSVALSSPLQYEPAVTIHGKKGKSDKSHLKGSRNWNNIRLHVVSNIGINKLISPVKPCNKPQEIISDIGLEITCQHGAWIVLGRLKPR